MGIGPSPMEIAVIAVIALIVIGPQKLPEAARSLGQGFREMRDSFQGAVKDDDDELDLDDDDEDEDDDVDPDDEASPSLETDDETVVLDTGSAPQEGLEEDHQNDARSSVPSSSSSSTERE